MIFFYEKKNIYKRMILTNVGIAVECGRINQKT